MSRRKGLIEGALGGMGNKDHDSYEGEILVYAHFDFHLQVRRSQICQCQVRVKIPGEKEEKDEGELARGLA